MIEILKELTFTIGTFLSYALGGAILVVSCYTFYWLRRRQFHRRNALGTECFNSYAHMIWTRNFEFFIRMLAFLGLFLGPAIIAIVIVFG